MLAPNLDSNEIDFERLKNASQNVDAARLYAESALYVLERNLEIVSFSGELREALDVLKEIGNKIKCLLGYEPDFIYKTKDELENPESIRQAFSAADTFLQKAKEAAIDGQVSVGDAGCSPWFENEILELNGFVYLINDVRSRLASIYKRASAAPVIGLRNLLPCYQVN